MEHGVVTMSSVNVRDFLHHNCSLVCNWIVFHANLPSVNFDEYLQNLQHFKQTCKQPNKNYVYFNKPHNSMYNFEHWTTFHLSGCSDFSVVCYIGQLTRTPWNTWLILHGQLFQLIQQTAAHTVGESNSEVPRAIEGWKKNSKMEAFESLYRTRVCSTEDLEEHQRWHRIIMSKFPDHI
jgi:hypothetical protein